jgi:RNA-directed DNA polymerase
MSLWSWLRSLLFGDPMTAPDPSGSQTERDFAPSTGDSDSVASSETDSGLPVHRGRGLPRLRFADAKRRERRVPRDLGENVVEQRPYAFARPSVFGGYFDLSQDGSPERLRNNDMPVFATPAELAKWLELTPGQLAWLVHRFDDQQTAGTRDAAHYTFCWVDKRSGGRRLIEAPKPLLAKAQRKILREILDKVPAHTAAHGFVVDRSALTNAEAHVGHKVVVKCDLRNFFPSVGFARVCAIFRSLGYSREAANWLARLTTTVPPLEFQAAARKPGSDWAPYRLRHLPQGACTSPALANLSAFVLDLRLSGLSRRFGAEYTRYADDLTFSGDGSFLRGLKTFLPLMERVVKSCRFVLHADKRRIMRRSARQTVTGIVVNEKPNISRRDFDALKATLVNCVRSGPSTQNRKGHDDYRAHLRGKIAHVVSVNPRRGAKLMAIFAKIDWSK